MSNSQWSPAARTALLVVAFLVVAAIVVALAIELFISWCGTGSRRPGTGL